jgi:putative FmdB family regulatory protein
MPYYDFHCPDCDDIYEVKRSFSEAGKAAPCPTCGSTETRKLLVTIAVHNSESIPVHVGGGGGGCCGGSCGCGH